MTDRGIQVALVNFCVFALRFLQPFVDGRDLGRNCDGEDQAERGCKPDGPAGNAFLPQCAIADERHADRQRRVEPTCAG